MPVKKSRKISWEKILQEQRNQTELLSEITSELKNSSLENTPTNKIAKMALILAGLSVLFQLGDFSTLDLPRQIIFFCIGLILLILLLDYLGLSTNLWSNTSKNVPVKNNVLVIKSIDDKTADNYLTRANLLLTIGSLFWVGFLASLSIQNQTIQLFSLGLTPVAVISLVEGLHYYSLSINKHEKTSNIFHDVIKIIFALLIWIGLSVVMNVSMIFNPVEIMNHLNYLINLTGLLIFCLMIKLAQLT